MAIRNWHYGKILILWLIALTILTVFYMEASRHKRGETILIWLLFTSPLIVITWKWLSGREEKTFPGGAEEAIDTSFAPKNKGRGVLKWLGLTLCLVGIVGAILPRGTILPAGYSDLSPLSPLRSETFRSATPEQKEWFLDQLYPSFKNASPESKAIVLQRLRDRIAEIESWAWVSPLQIWWVDLTLNSLLVLVGLAMFRWGLKKETTSKGTDVPVENQ